MGKAQSRDDHHRSQTVMGTSRSSTDTRSRRGSNTSQEHSRLKSRKKSTGKARSTQGKPSVELSREELVQVCERFVKQYENCLNDAIKALESQDDEAARFALFELRWCDRNSKLTSSGAVLPLLHSHSNWNDIKSLRDKVEMLLPCVPIQLEAKMHKPDEVEIACTNLAGNEVA